MLVLIHRRCRRRTRFPRRCAVREHIDLASRLRSQGVLGHNRGRPRRGSHSIELRLASAAFVASNDSACSPIALPTSVDESPSGVGQQPFVDWVTSSKLRSRDRVDKPPRENSSCHPRVPRPAVASDGEEAGTALHTILDITDRWAHGNYRAARPSHVPRTTDGFVETATDVRALSNQERRD